MSAARVVPGFNPSEDGNACFGLGLPIASGDEFALQAGKEALGHGVVVAAILNMEKEPYKSTTYKISKMLQFKISI